MVNARQILGAEARMKKKLNARKRNSGVSLHIDGRLGGRTAAAGAENRSRTFEKLIFPCRNLIGVNVKLLRDLRQCTVALDGG